MNPETQKLIGKKDAPIGWMIFNNPGRRNAVSSEMWEAIPKVLEAFEADPEVRVVVMTGAGDKAFVSGADISQFEDQRANREANERYSVRSGAGTAALASLKACFESADYAEGRRAFMEKRKPNFQGR